MSETRPDAAEPGFKDRATAAVRRYRDDHRWLAHVLEAWGLLQRNNGSQYAAAITYFSFLALFPLVLLAVAVLGFVLSSNPGVENSVFTHLESSVPGAVGSILHQTLQAAIRNRTSVGVVGLVGVLLTGLGWIGNLRSAIDAVYGRRPAKKNFLLSRASNLLVLGGLGLGMIVSLGLTAVGTSLTGQILRAAHLDSLPGSTILLKILGIAVAAAGDMIIFWWVLVRLPQVELPHPVVLRGAVLAAVGFEILKIVGTFTVAHTANSPTAGPFAGVLAVLIWIQLVSRYLLFCCAWLATAVVPERTANTVPIVASEAAAEQPARAAEPSPVTPATVGATLVGAGAIAGAVAHWAVTRPRSGDGHD